jgi:4-amino-4-deoxy-L-arabinose transferase-like glycosyltransferase
MGRKFVLPLFSGFLGMFVCHFLILLAFGSGVRFPIYLFTYPIVYPIIAILLTITKRELWLSNGLLICILPFLYWYLLLWSDGKINLKSFSFLKDTGMLAIMPVTALLSCFMSYFVGKRKIILRKMNNKNHGTS